MFVCPFFWMDLEKLRDWVFFNEFEQIIELQSEKDIW